MEQESWKEVEIGIDVRADRNQYYRKNTYRREELEVGGIIDDRGLDGRDVFNAVKVKAMDEQSLTITYSDREYTLNKEKKYVYVDSGGRDYASFDLEVSIHF